MTNDGVIDIFRKTGALLEGHFILTSGYHSPHYFQCAKVLQYPEYNQLFSKAIADHFCGKIGRQLNVRTVFSERENGEMKLRRGFEINKGENVLVCEDVVTTGGSVFEVIELVKRSGANLAGVGFIIDRSNGKVDFGADQFSLAKMEVIKFAEDKLPDWLTEIPVSKPGSRKISS